MAKKSGWGVASKLTPNPETGFDEVHYAPAFEDALETLNKTLKILKNISYLEDVQNIEKFDSLRKELHKLRNDFRTYLRQNYPKEYMKYKNRTNEVKQNLKTILTNKIEEISATGGTATFTPGIGAQYTTKYAFNPNKGAKGSEKNYYIKLGYKLAPKKIKGSGMEVKQLFESIELEKVNLPDDIKEAIKSAWLGGNVERIRKNNFMYIIDIATGGMNIDDDMLKRLLKNKRFRGVYPKDGQTVQLGFLLNKK
jgi:hypothetical protein